MTLIETILSGILAITIGWVITNIISFILKKRRLESAILNDIKCHLPGLKEAQIFFNKIFDNTITEGKIIDNAPYYLRCEYNFYNNIQMDIIKYLSEQKVVKIIKFYNALWDTEAMNEGIIMDIHDWKSTQREIRKEDINHLKRKIARMNSLSNILLEREFRNLDDLPNDYRGRLCADSLIE